MTIQNSAAVRNAALDSFETTVGTSAKVEMFTGAQPSDCSQADSGTKLISVTLASDWAGAASGGSKAFLNTPIATTAIAAGTVGHYRIKSSGGTVHEQGSVTATGGGGDVTIDNVVLANGQAVNITGWTKTAPGA